MPKTCLGCAHFERVKVRGQWCQFCRKQKITAPMLKCKDHEPRFKTEPARNGGDIGAELL